MKRGGGFAGQESGLGQNKRARADRHRDVSVFGRFTNHFNIRSLGLLSGKSATTFHAAFGNFAMQFPDIHLKRGARFVEDGNLASAGGLSSGIDLALRVVERYYGREIAKKTAYNMEYQGQGWMESGFQSGLRQRACLNGRTSPLSSLRNGCRCCDCSEVCL